MIALHHYLILSAVIFAIGVIGVLIRRNLIVILMSIELMLNAVNLTFIAFSRYLGSTDGQVVVFFVMAVAAALCALLYLGLQLGRRPAGGVESRRPLAQSRGVVLRLAALFSLDSFGGGFAVQSILARWLFRRFEFSLAEAGALFFGMGVLAAFSQLASAPLARRIGLVHVRRDSAVRLATVAPLRIVAWSAVLCVGGTRGRMLSVPRRPVVRMSERQGAECDSGRRNCG